MVGCSPNIEPLVMPPSARQQIIRKHGHLIAAYLAPAHVLGGQLQHLFLELRIAAGMYRQQPCRIHSIADLVENTAPDGCDHSGAALWKDNRLIAEYEDDMNGKPTKERRTISKITPNSFTVIIEIAIGDAPLRPVITIEYEREGAAD
jgi:hypothetical protein